MPFCNVRLDSLLEQWPAQQRCPALAAFESCCVGTLGQWDSKSDSRELLELPAGGQRPRQAVPPAWLRRAEAVGAHWPTRWLFALWSPLAARQFQRQCRPNQRYWALGAPVDWYFPIAAPVCSNCTRWYVNHAGTKYRMTCQQCRNCIWVNSQSVSFNCRARGIQPIVTTGSAQPYFNPRRTIRFFCHHCRPMHDKVELAPMPPLPNSELRLESHAPHWPKPSPVSSLPFNILGAYVRRLYHCTPRNPLSRPLCPSGRRRTNCWDSKVGRRYYFPKSLLP